MARRVIHRKLWNKTTNIFENKNTLKFWNFSKIFNADFSRSPNCCKESQTHPNINYSSFRSFQKNIENFEKHYKNKIFENCSGILCYFIESPNGINWYILRYLRVSWWTLRLFKTKRITRQFSIRRNLLKKSHEGFKSIQKVIYISI